MPPIYPVLYWRDEATKISVHDLDALILAEPTQVLLFDDDPDEHITLERIIEGGDDGTTNEPGLNPADGSITVNKQQGRSGVPTLTIQGTVKATGATYIAWRDKARAFAAKNQIEHSFHKKGIIGFFHPDMTDFNVDPSETVGLTMGLPFFDYIAPGEIMTYRFSFTKGS